MLIRPIRLEEKNLYNSIVNHPLQTWEWGEFRKKTGKKIERIGFFEDGQIQKAFQAIFHPIPKLNQFSIGYFPRGFQPDEEQISALKQIGQKHNAVFIKLEPNVTSPIENRAEFKPLIKFLVDNDCEPGRPFFAKYTYQVDLTQSEEELFAKLKSKTRYNVRLASRKGVHIVEDSSRKGLEIYLNILQETLDRQGFYLHSPEYFKTMWEQLKDSDMMHIFHAVYEDTPLVSWIMFKWKDVIYYPYGASLDAHRETMASNLMMWEMITWAKKQGAKTFDMWGSLGPEANQSDPWYGFHNFKKGYGGVHTRFVGTFDLILQQPHYKIFKAVDSLRWKFLRAKTRINDIF
jgi:lipid II:glycine glycyltransferase (peptidoglycan interpeptide bridge formation enzyme)